MSQSVVMFQGPFGLKEPDPDWLFGRKAMSLCGGVYIFAWRHAGKFFPHYIGQTRGPIVGRIVVHMRGYLSGVYWLYRPDALDSACRTGVRPAELYICRPRDAELHAAALRGGALSDYFSKLSFFLAEVPPDLRLPIEKALTDRAYGASPIMDSPRTNGAEPADVVAKFPDGVEVVGLM